MIGIHKSSYIHLFRYFLFATAVLQKKNLSFDDIVFVNLYVSDMSEFGSVNATFKKFFKLNPPSRYTDY